MFILDKLKLPYWNIGFSEIADPFSITDIKWLKHTYRDRFFADPFILDVSDEIIKVLVEEYFFKDAKAVITLLCVDRKDYSIINRKVVLDLPTHLSFPFIFRENEEVYIIPENSQSGSLSIYKYNTEKDSVEYINKLLEQPAVDPVIIKREGTYFLLCTFPFNNDEDTRLFIYHADRLTGPYEAVVVNPVKSDIRSARPGGDFFQKEGSLYRISQNCALRYGHQFNINEVFQLSKEGFQEKIVKSYLPFLPYSTGTHTCNMHKDILVIDGYIYQFRPFYAINCFLHRGIKR
ncbi:hypothetical protein LJC44_01200 [Parabacteroides sp. OttesenSCG-928-G06]|nr:hypothetical protein [Parabacteroides sp. OttesenSCG-928-G06]